MRAADVLTALRRWSGRLGALLLFGTSTAVGQAAVKRVPFTVTCPACRVEFMPIATIGKRSDPVSPMSTSGFDRDSRGRFFVMGDGARLLVYDASGAFLRAIGRRGPGPGEFNVSPGMDQAVDVVVEPGDTVLVFHLASVTVFSPELEYVRTVRRSPLPPGGVHVLADGSWLISGSIRRPENIGRSIHVLRKDGTVQRSLGPEVPVIAGERPEVSSFRLAPNQRSVWLYQIGSRYRLDHWSLDNVPLAAFEIYDIPDFSVESGRLRLNGIDTLGQLWVVRGDLNQKDRGRTLDILDPQSGQLRLSQRVPFPVGLLRRGDIAVSLEVDGDGFTTYTLYRYRFLQGP